ncbi:MAG: hypothetical protein LBV61_02655 [Burkholderiaceae bacterium]|jgi:hypothetical protein|nr:hypothetical protein [Burkholderiaceae bacterium]
MAPPIGGHAAPSILAMARIGVTQKTMFPRPQSRNGFARRTALDSGSGRLLALGLNLKADLEPAKAAHG